MWTGVGSEAVFAVYTARESLCQRILGDAECRKWEQAINIRKRRIDCCPCA